MKRTGNKHLLRLKIGINSFHTIRQHSAMIQSMADMDENIDYLFAEMYMPEPAQKVVRNILDEPIPETVKGRLLKPLFPKLYRPPRPPPTWKDRESKAILEQFDPLPPQKAIRQSRTTNKRFGRCLKKSRDTS